MKKENISNILWEKPKDFIDYDGNHIVEYITRALDGFGDGITIFLDGNKNQLTEDGNIIDELLSQNSIDYDTARRFYKKWDEIASDWGCHVTNDGELVCDDIEHGLVKMIQAATALIALSKYSKDWNNELGRNL